jgi:hypothetical protein
MSYTFLRWARFGIAAALDDNILEPGGGPRARITVGVDVAATDSAVPRAYLALDVLGPGDVASIDQRQVVRTFPVPGTLDFEDRYLAHVEFDRPDLPWLFTPATPGANGALRPWISLVVVEKRDGVEIVPSTPLPILKITSGAGTELGPLANAHLWAHVQVTGSATKTLDVITRDEPERVISRLVCGRALEADTSYVACVVPNYEVGVDAGLGNEVVDDAILDDAWTPAQTSIELPVYFHWEFATGGTGDFKSLVTRLEGREDLPGVGTRTLDVTAPGFGLAPRCAESTVPIGGALQVTAAAPPPVDETLADALLEALDEQGVTPPLYGRWHAGETLTKRSTRTPGWLEALNLDPRYRVAAGLGTKVVQDRQEDLMAAVWEQFGELERANQLLRQAQLAVAAAERVVACHLTPLSDLELLAVAGPALGRIRVSAQRTTRRAVSESCAPVIAFSGAFRRVVRTHGPLGRRFTRFARPHISDVMHEPSVSPAVLLEGLADGRWNLPLPPLPDGAIAAPASLVRELVREAEREVVRESGRRSVRLVRDTDSPSVRLVGETDSPLAELLPAFMKLAASAVSTSCTSLDYATLATTVRDALAPDVAIPPRVRAQIDVPQDPRVFASDRLDPVMAAPEIPTPMIGPLIELGQDWLLPGLVNVTPNTVTIVEPDTAFIEAYMVGLNHEMGRELLWRGFPTDQRGTVFARFWDRRGAVASPNARIPARDIDSIATWDVKRQLGRNMTASSGAGIILLLRGDLLLRYPRSTIYMQRARWKRDSTNAIVVEEDLAVREPVPLPDDAAWDTHVRFPSLTGRVGADITYLGFPLGRTEVGGLERTSLPRSATDQEAGWFVVFQEQPTEPRFGFPAPTPALPTLITQPELVATELVRSAFRVSSPTEPPFGAPAVAPGLPAGITQAEAVATALIRPAFRLFVHASDLVA